MSGSIVHDPNLPVAYVNGHIIPTGKKPVTGQQLIDSLSDALTELYDGEDPSKMGMTRKEAAMTAWARKAADGDLDAIRMLADRILGKPIQQVNSLNVTTDLKSFLSSLHLPGEQSQDRKVDPFGDL
jgi:hypothetical protein